MKLLIIGGGLAGYLAHKVFSDCNPIVFEASKNIQIFSEKFWPELPETCRKGCIPRLSSINTFADEHWKDYKFI